MSEAMDWSEIQLGDGQWMKRKFGQIWLFVLSARHEWRVAQVPSAVAEKLPDHGVLSDLTERFNWQRWNRCAEDTQIHFRPAYPTLPVVARPRDAFFLSPQGRTDFYVGIPACVDVLGGCNGKMIKLCSFSTENLTKTWHGTTHRGNLAFALRTEARRDLVAEPFVLHEIIFKVEISNNGKVHLPFERLYVETQHLAIFDNGRQLWGNAARIHIDPENHSASNITYAANPSADAGDVTQLTAPREGRKRSSVFRSSLARVIDQFDLFQEI